MSRPATFSKLGALLAGLLFINAALAAGAEPVGVKVPPKYRGPGGETWAGRGATPRWLTVLIKEGHSIEEFLIGSGRKARSAAAKKAAAKKRGTKPTRKVRPRKQSPAKGESASAE